MASLGAPLRAIGAFVWSEAALVLGAALCLPRARMAASKMLVAMLQHVFDPPPDHLAIPWGFLAGLGGAAILAAVLAAALVARELEGSRSGLCCGNSDGHALTALISPRVAIVEDDAELSASSLRGLREEGFEVAGGRDRSRAARARRRSARRARGRHRAAGRRRARRLPGAARARHAGARAVPDRPRRPGRPARRLQRGRRRLPDEAVRVRRAGRAAARAAAPRAAPDGALEAAGLRLDPARTPCRAAAASCADADGVPAAGRARRAAGRGGAAPRAGRAPGGRTARSCTTTRSTPTSRGCGGSSASCADAPEIATVHGVGYSLG